MKYKCGYKYQTQEDVVVPLPELSQTLTASSGIWVSLKNKEIRLTAGYAWDGASFILFLWFGTPELWKTPSLIHDGLYQLMRESKLPLTNRKTADGIFYRLLRERGVWWINARLAYLAVRIGGNYCARHGAPIKEAV